MVAIMNWLPLSIFCWALALSPAGWLVGQNHVPASDTDANGNGKPVYAIAIHGGAGDYPSVQNDQSVMQRRNSLRSALQVGTGILKEGGTSLQAVEEVIRILEDDPLFNAGVGSVYNSTGGHELDASIMDGRNLSCGAVAGITRVKNPITLARLVMQKTPHVLLAGPGAEIFASKMQVEFVEPSYFDTDHRFKQFQKLKARQNGQQQPGKTEKTGQQLQLDRHYGTVGCVALDTHGNLAAGTSTGGTPNKQFGRIGDSPVIGAGTYADNATCAVSCTGQGEEYIRHAIAYDIAAQMRYADRSLEESVSDVILHRLQPGDGGVIAVDRQGNIVMQYNTEAMARGAANSSGRFDVYWELAPERKQPRPSVPAPAADGSPAGVDSDSE